MDRLFVTIGGQPLYSRREAPDLDHEAAHLDARDGAGRLRAAPKVSSGGLASAGSEKTLLEGLLVVGAFAAVLLFTIAALVLAKCRRASRTDGGCFDAPCPGCSSQASLIKQVPEP